MSCGAWTRYGPQRTQLLIVTFLTFVQMSIANASQLGICTTRHGVRKTMGIDIKYT